MRGQQWSPCLLRNRAKWTGARFWPVRFVLLGKSACPACLYGHRHGQVGPCVPCTTRPARPSNIRLNCALCLISVRASPPLPFPREKLKKGFRPASFKRHGIECQTCERLAFANHCARYLPPSRGLNRGASLVSCSYPSKKRGVARVQSNGTWRPRGGVLRRSGTKGTWPSFPR